MTPTDPSSVPLRDIHLPEAVSWWPLAPGWWVVITLATLAISGLVIWRTLKHRHRLRDAALGELAGLERRFERDGDKHAYARALSTLVRRFFLTSGQAEPSLTGSQWLDSLNQSSAGALPDELTPILLEAPYSAARADQLSADLYTRAATVVRAWIMAKKRPPKATAEASRRNV